MIKMSSAILKIMKNANKTKIKMIRNYNSIQNAMI